MDNQINLAQAVKESNTFTEVLRKLGKRISGSAFKCLKNKILKSNIDISHFSCKHDITQFSKKKKSADEILILTDRRICHSKLKRALIEKNKEYQCEICGINEWNKKSIKLEVDHINGNAFDSRFENVRFLCPNCHSQETYKNKTKPERKPKPNKYFLPEKELLLILIWEKPLSLVAQEFGISANGLKKRCKKLGLNFPSRGYWQKKYAS